MSDFKVGQTVALLDGRQAVIRFIGTLHIAEGQFIGVEFADPSGKNDGSVRGERYFDCAPNHGMFMRASNVAEVIIDAPKPAPKVKPRPASPVKKPAPRASRQSMALPPARRTSIVPTTSSAATSRPTSSRPAPTASGLGSRAPSTVSSTTSAKPAANRLSLAPRSRPAPTVSSTTTAASSNVAISKRPAASHTSSTTRTSSTQDKKVEELETKLRVLEKQRLEDKEKIKALDHIQQERDKFESIIQKLQAKYQPIQQENVELKKGLKDAENTAEKIALLQEDHDTDMEMITLEREMAEEKAENYMNEVTDLKQRVEELELENEILKDENLELGQDISPEEKTSASWVQMERENERLRDALIRLRDVSREQEAELRSEIKSLEEDVQDLAQMKEKYEDTKAKLLESEADIQDLRQQLDAALGAEEMIEELSDQNIVLKDKIDELKLVVDDLQDLKELNDELEINHVENEKELRQELELKETEISDSLRAVAQHEEALATQEYAIVKYREAFASLQSDLEEMRANKEISETEAQDLAQRSKELADLNLKLNQSATNTMITTIDMELRKLDAQEASEHLAIVQLFLPEAFQSERDSVLGLLRCRRISFKAKLLHGLIREPLNAPGKHSMIHDEDVFEVCDALNQLVWIAEMSDRFISGVSSCSLEQFARFGAQGAIFDLEPVEKALDTKIEALRKNDFPGRTVAEELQRSVAVLKHLASQHEISSASLDGGADELKMSVELIQSNLDVTITGLTLISYEVGKTVPFDDADDGVARFLQKSDAVIAAGRSAKIVVGKTLRALQDLRSRSLSLTPDTHPDFEACEEGTAQLAKYCRVLGENLFSLLKQEGQPEPPTYSAVRSILFKTTESFFTDSPIDSDIYSTLSTKLRVLKEELSNLHAMSTTLNRTVEFERATAPWVLKSREIAASKLISIDVEDEMRALQEDLQKHAMTIRLRDHDIEEKNVKIELLEARTRDASKKASKIHELEQAISSLRSKEESLLEEREKRDREIRVLKLERERWADAAKMQTKLSESGSANGARTSSADTDFLESELAATRKSLERYRRSVEYLRKENSKIHREEKQERRSKLDELAKRQRAEDSEPTLEQHLQLEKENAAREAAAATPSKPSKAVVEKVVEKVEKEVEKVVEVTPGKKVQQSKLVAAEVAKIESRLNALQVTPRPREKRLKWEPKSRTPQSALATISEEAEWDFSPYSLQKTMNDVAILKAEKMSPVKGVKIGNKWVFKV